MIQVTLQRLADLPYEVTVTVVRIVQADREWPHRQSGTGTGLCCEILTTVCGGMEVGLWVRVIRLERWMEKIFNDARGPDGPAPAARGGRSRAPLCACVSQVCERDCETLRLYS